MELTVVSALQVGMETAEDVVDRKGNIIVPINTKLDKLMIQKISLANIMCISTKEPEDYKTTYFEKIKVSKTFGKFYSLYMENFNNYKMLMEVLISNKQPINPDILLSMVNNIMQPFDKSKITILDMLVVLEMSESDYLYAHALNVALICSYTAKWFKLDQDDTNTLILSGFYYDIGKFLIPQEILNKQGKLTDQEFMTIKSHTLLGYQLLKDMDIDDRIKLCALMHHEKCDKSGYPQGLSSDMIHPFAKILAILDSYEAMTSYRSYREPLCPFKVIEIFEKDGYGKYDTGYYITFLERMVEEYIGKEVQLNDGTICDVLLINKQALSKPMVKSKDYYIDLSRENNLYIKSLI